MFGSNHSVKVMLLSEMLFINQSWATVEEFSSLLEMCNLDFNPGPLKP